MDNKDYKEEDDNLNDNEGESDSSENDNRNDIDEKGQIGNSPEDDKKNGTENDEKSERLDRALKELLDGNPEPIKGYIRRYIILSVIPPGLLLKEERHSKSISDKDSPRSGNYRVYKLGSYSRNSKTRR